MTNPDWERQRERMVREQLIARGIADRRVLEALAAVPREAFVEPDTRDESYHDRPLPIFGGQTISQPYTVALMAEALELRGDEKILDIGTGSGYAAAVLSLLGREVISIERLPHLAESAAERLARLGYTNVRVLIGDGSLGSPPDAPFDAITVAAAGYDAPPSLLAQLADAGRLVIPLGPTQQTQSLFRFRRTGTHVSKESLGAFSFVPLIGAEGWDA